jgi:hypothetical protein
MREFERLLAKPRREDMPAEERADYDAVEARTHAIDYERYGVPVKYFSALLNSPPLAALLVRMGTFVRQGSIRGEYSDAERELVDVVLGTDLGYNGIFTVHLPDAIAVGVRHEAITAIRSGQEASLTADERQVVDYARAVVAGEVTDESWAAMAARLGDRGALEFTAFIGFLLMTIRLWQALGVPDPSAEEIDDLVAGLVSGAVAVPDPTARLR